MKRRFISIIFVCFLAGTGNLLAGEQGKNANSSGDGLEDAMAELLVAAGCQFRPHRLDIQPLKAGQVCVAYRQPAYRTIYDTTGRADFLINTALGLVRVEAKRQQVRG